MLSLILKTPKQKSIPWPVSSQDIAKVCEDTYHGIGTITNCTITNSGGYGIAYRSSDPVTVSGNTFKDNTKEDVYNFK